MRIKIKNTKSIKELEQKRRERINDEVLKFLDENGYPVNKLAISPLDDLVKRVHNDNKKVITDVRNEVLNRNPVNNKMVLAFDLIIYFKELKR